jgi:signal peptidase I
MNLGAVAARLQNGEQCTFKASGASMEPRIRNGQIVTVEPFPRGSTRKGMVVLARVKGRWYLHLVTGVRKGQVQISNNKGHVNGWTSIVNVVGLLAEGEHG